MNDYPNAGLENAQPEVRKAVERFRQLPDDQKSDKVLLWWLLGSGTPQYKMSKEDSQYTDKSTSNNACASCKFMYLKEVTDQRICSQISGTVQPKGWCRLWKQSK